MSINLINGIFSRKDALELVSQLIQTKISFHETKISAELDEEDIKRREDRIRELQNELQTIRQEFSNTTDRISLICKIEIEK